MVYPMHGSCLDGSVFPKYVEAIVKRFCLYWYAAWTKVVILQMQIGKSLYPKWERDGERFLSAWLDDFIETSYKLMEI